MDNESMVTEHPERAIIFKVEAKSASSADYVSRLLQRKRGYGNRKGNSRGNISVVS